jgi:hypothetical protein
MKNQIKQIGQHGVNNLVNVQVGTYASDLHNELFNMDYFIIGTYQAKQFLNKYDIFEAIDKVNTYEKEHFGEVITEISNPEKLVNMLAYIIGEELLSNCQTLQTKWDDRLTKTDLNKIKRELKQAIKNV